MKISAATAAAVAAAALSLCPAVGVAQQDPRVAQLIGVSGDALGLGSLESVETIRLVLNASALGLNGTAVQYVNVRTGQFAETTILPPVVELDGYDGHVEWSGDRTALIWNQGGDSDRSSELNQAYVESYALWISGTSGADIAWAGTKSAGATSYDVLRITPAGSKVPFDLWFDRTTHLPARADFVNGFTTSTLTFSDYRRVEGLNVAHAIHIESSDGNNVDLHVTSVRFNAPGSQAALARPSSHPTDFSIQGGKTSTTIPFTLGENHVYLDVMLDGKGPYRFVFDTGGANVVDAAVAKEIGAFGAGSAQGSGVGAQTENFSLANVAKLQVGDAVLTNQLFAVAPTRLGFGVATGRPVDGIIGWEVLARFITTFDYANSRVVLNLPGTAQPAAGAHVVPFVLYGTQPQIACRLDGIPSECTIDTGARDTITFMTPFLAANPQVVPATLTAVGINGFGFGGAALGKLGRVQSVGIDDFELTNLVADFSVQTAGALTAPFVGANIGGNLLRRFSVTFDYYNSTMALVPNADFKQPDEYERSGLFLIKHGGSIVAADSRPGTPAAEAGIAKGDTIVAIDGTPANTLQLADIRNTLAQPAGTVVTLTVAGKDGTQRTVKITLRDYV